MPLLHSSHACSQNCTLYHFQHCILTLYARPFLSVPSQNCILTTYTSHRSYLPLFLETYYTLYARSSRFSPIAR